LIFAYVGVIAMLLFLENFLLFHPTKASDEWFNPPNSQVQDVYLTTRDGVRIHAWWCPVEGAEGALIYCHGNAGNLSHRSQGIATWQQQMRLSVMIFDYPGYGKSEGRPSEAGCYAAADAAYQWLTESQRITAEQVVIYGSSLGAAVAVDLARRRPHRALVLISAFTSIPDMAQKFYPWLPARWLVRNRFDNLASIGQCRQPVFIAHGDQDSLVPFEMGEQLYRAAAEPKRFYTMRGHGHNEGPDHDFFTALRQFWKDVEPAAVKLGQSNLSDEEVLGRARRPLR
jgi:fermentation-respiration switch protein FrsA (DUF1100 family)